ncbi:MAG: hypothetical protein GY847_36010 [Proteobacteria bacterium]|nr:hypothetical protein [Pseudomonadota bacterium]
MKHLLFLIVLANFFAVNCGDDDSAASDADTGADIDADSDSDTDSDLDADFDGGEPDENCDGTEPVCNDDDLLVCEEGKRARLPCEETTFCNFDACQELDVSFPEDAAHHNYRSEWWYYTGHLTDGDNEWGFQVTIFQYDLTLLDGYMCHVAVIDKTAGEHYHRDQFALAPAKLSKSPIELHVGACRFELAGDGFDHIYGRIPEGLEKDGKATPWIIDLELEPLKRPAFHGGDGLIPMSDAGGKSWYYSYTRLAAVGTLETPDGPRDVTGQAWFDHQWGPFDVVTQFKGWDWWSMQLDDDWEIMLFQFYNWEGEMVTQAGTIIDPDGNQTELEGLKDFTIVSLREWESPHTDGTYPLDWDIEIVNMGWSLEVRTEIDDVEMHNNAQNYWEGNTVISGFRGDQPISGIGFTELTGYASDILDP